MDSLGHILGNKDYEEPPMVQSIKSYVKSEFKADVGVQISDKSVIINVPNSSLANMLRLRLPDLRRRCQIDGKIVLRITH